MSAIRIFARAVDGSEVEVTDGVKVIYDSVISSMDWGSGFLSTAEVLEILRCARACGFDSPGYLGTTDYRRYPNATADQIADYERLLLELAAFDAEATP